jgi:hypothetical protein
MKNIEDMGISPSLILNHINKIRTNLEHFYKIPNNERVEDAIQVARLFLDVTTLSLSNFWNEFEFFNENQEIKGPKGGIYNGVYGIFEQKRYELRYYVNGVKDRTIEISYKEREDYIRLINLSVEIGKSVHDFDKIIPKRLFKRFYSSLI